MDEGSSPGGASEEAYKRHLTAILAVPEDEIRPINVSIATAAIHVLGAIRTLAAFRDALVSLPGFLASAIDDLQALTHAMLFAHGQYRMASTPAPLTTWIKEALELRERLQVVIQSAVHYRLIPAPNPDMLHGGNKHADIGMDLIALESFLQASWPAMVGKTATTQEELARAAALGETLITTIGVRQHAPRVSEVAMIRAKAFTLFFNAYEEVRHGMIYLRRRHGDAEKLVPSLYPGRKKKSRAKKDEARIEADHKEVNGEHSPATPTTG